MQQTPMLLILMTLQGKIIVHENRLYRIDVYTTSKTRVVEDVKSNLLQNFFGGKSTFKEIVEEDVDCIYLVSCKQSKTHLCMSPGTFCKEVLLKPDEAHLTMFYTRRKMTEYFNLKADFYTLYEMSPKEEKHKADNI